MEDSSGGHTGMANHGEPATDGDTLRAGMWRLSSKEKHKWLMSPAAIPIKKYYPEVFNPPLPKDFKVADVLPVTQEARAKYLRTMREFHEERRREREWKAREERQKKAEERLKQKRKKTRKSDDDQLYYLVEGFYEEDEGVLTYLKERVVREHSDGSVSVKVTKEKLKMR